MRLAAAQADLVGSCLGPASDRILLKLVGCDPVTRIAEPWASEVRTLSIGTIPLHQEMLYG